MAFGNGQDILDSDTLLSSCIPHLSLHPDAFFHPPGHYL